jgi:hypothetical protein
VEQSLGRERAWGPKPRSFGSSAIQARGTYRFTQKQRCSMTPNGELQNIPATQGCVTVICTMAFFDYLSARSVTPRDGGQLIP